MGKLFANGITQADLITALTELCTDWQATIDKLEADIGDVDWSAHNVALKTEFSQKGVTQDAVVRQLQDIVTSFNAILAHLDADDGVNSTDFAATYAVTDKINEAAYSGDIQNCGVFQGDIIRLLYDLKTNINLALAHMDADTTLTDVNYASTNGIGYSIDVTGC